MCASARRNVQRGFTLVELLVVIAIISLLISLLAPSLGSARRQARTIACAGQLRTIAMAGQFFAGDNEGSFPHRFYWRLGDTRPYSLMPYLELDGRNQEQNRRILACPEFFQRWPTAYDNSKTRAINSSAYRWDGTSSSDGGIREAARPHYTIEVPSPSGMHFISDTTSISDEPINPTMGYYYNTHVTRSLYASAAADFPERFAHNDGLNFSFLDGHVERLTRAQVREFAADAAHLMWRGGY